jgi:glycosyltransferase involved in cell wall biosynthesis
MSYDLAIIMPAYKPDFLKEAVETILSQSDQRFSFYVFDDASPHNLNEIVKKFDASDKIRYHRFEENFGQKSLVRQWNRCINMTENEPWIWLFSDDDKMDSNCVEAFYKTVREYPGHNAYRFNTHKISTDGESIRENHFPETLDAADFLNLKLSYQQESYVVETLFSRKAFEKSGGIPDLPMAWASDDLFTIKLAQSKVIRTIQGAKVYWRYSDKNISGKNSRSTAVKKMEGAREFVNWIISEKKINDKLEPNDLPARWYVRQIRTLLGQLTLLDEWRAVYEMAKTDKRVWKHYISMKKEKSRTIRWLKKFSS